MSNITFHPSIKGLGSFGQYSPVSEADTSNGLVVIAGQFGTQEDTTFRYGPSGQEQTTGAFESLRIALAEAGLGFEDVIKFQTFLVGREMVKEFKTARTEVFKEIYPGGVYPPNTILVVDGLVEERFLVEIEALAVRRPGQGGGANG